MSNYFHGLFGLSGCHTYVHTCIWMTEVDKMLRVAAVTRGAERTWWCTVWCGRIVRAAVIAIAGVSKLFTVFGVTSMKRDREKIVEEREKTWEKGKSKADYL